VPLVQILHQLIKPQKAAGKFPAPNLRANGINRFSVNAVSDIRSTRGGVD
jgi:hypothetical protein